MDWLLVVGIVTWLFTIAVVVFASSPVTIGTCIGCSLALGVNFGGWLAQ